MINDRSVPERIFTTYIKPIDNGLTSQTFSIPYLRKEYFETSDILTDGAYYTITASGVASCWYNYTDGVDACFCYAKWRCPTAEYWGMIRIDERSFRDYDPSITYNGSHVYKIRIKGTGQKIKLYAYDGGGYEDNNGTFTVTVEKE